jgi:hypothetical protein
MSGMVEAMREPTEAMAECADEEMLMRASWQEDIWRAMIDGALR